MNERKRYWMNRLSSREQRKGWLSEMKALGLYADVRATDLQGHSDHEGTHYLIGRRSVALEQWDEASRLVPVLVAEAVTEDLVPYEREKEKPQDGSAAE